MNMMERELYLYILNGYQPMCFVLYQISEYKRRLDVLQYMKREKLIGATAFDYIQTKCSGSTFRFVYHVLAIIDHQKKQANISDLIIPGGKSG